MCSRPITPWQPDADLLGAPLVLKLAPQRLDSPRGASASEEVVVAGQDAGVDDHREGHGRPVPPIAWDPPNSRLLQRRVYLAWDDLDGPRLNQAAHGLLQGEPLLSRQAALGFQDAKPPGKLVLGLVPLMFCDEDAEVGMKEKLPAPLA
jgi:hypothetical protein